MQLEKFNVICPFEIGEKVYTDKRNILKYQNYNDEPGNEVRTITDIACIHYVKSGKVEFRYEFDNDDWYWNLEYIK